MKKIIVLYLFGITMLMTSPMIVYAQSGVSCNEAKIQQAILYGTANSCRIGVEHDGVCHCGARREKVELLRTRTGGCIDLKHDVNKCVFYDHRYYFYCTNPYCNDSWYSEWENYKAEHNIL